MLEKGTTEFLGLHFLYGRCSGCVLVTNLCAANGDIIVKVSSESSYRASFNKTVSL